MEIYNHIQTEDLDFLPFINYETIVCSQFPNPSPNINCACLGVHFIKTNEVYLHAYEGSHSKMLLTPGRVFAINFSEKFEEYVIAGLKTLKMEDRFDELPRDSFYSLKPAPMLQSSWCSIICEIVEMPQEFIKKPSCRRRQSPNLRAKIIQKHLFRYPVLFNNRAWNLAIEALILANNYTRDKKNPMDSNKLLTKYRNIKQKITAWWDMERFEDGFTRMDNYLIDNGVHPQDLFDY